MVNILIRNTIVKNTYNYVAFYKKKIINFLVKKLLENFEKKKKKYKIEIYY